jgi:hypothetical protein
MPRDADDAFYERADEHIRLSNDQMGDVARGKVSASMLYGTSRFNAWVSACGFENGADMAEKKKETIKYFVDEYAKMLEENMDDYIANFAQYMKRAQ